jgi:hypothetical protein
MTSTNSSIGGPFNSRFEEAPIVPRAMGTGPRTPPASIISKRAGALVRFDSTAPFWLINAFRNILYDYVSVKHLQLTSFVKDASADNAIMYAYMKRQIASILCRDTATVGARFELNYKNVHDGLVMMQAGLFAPVDGRESRETFDPCNCFYYLQSGCRIELGAEVVETPGHLSGIKPIVANFAFATATERRLAIEDVDRVFEDRHVLEMREAASEPFQVTLQLHGDSTLVSLWKRAHGAFEARLDALSASLDGLQTHQLNVGGRGFTSYMLTVDEPRGHITSLVTAHLNESFAATTTSASAYYDPITMKSELRVVFGGTATELKSLLKAQIVTLKQLISRFNGPA